MAGKQKIEDALTRELGISFGETTKDKKYTLEHTNCMGMCDQGPAMLINDKVFTRLDPEKAVNILKEVE
jgi:NADH:ubiquinone oxidoreductase subunit E